MSQHWKLFKPYKCRHCGKAYVILVGRCDYRYVPVNYEKGFDFSVKHFDKTKHTSHFLSCPALAEQWGEITKAINKEEQRLSKLFV